MTAATWQWYEMLDAALQGQHNITPPLVVASSSSATAGGVVVNAPASTPEPTNEGRANPRKRPREDDMLAFIKEQAEREEERERAALAREEAREKAAENRANRYLALFEKLIEKF